MNPTAVFVTDNLKLASALTAAGFRILDGHKIIKDGKSLFVCDLEPKHNGIKADYLRDAFFNKIDLSAEVDRIITSRGITPEEYVVMAFDAARAGLHNRSKVLTTLSDNKTLVCKSFGNGRTLIYRDGTPKDRLKRLIDNA